MKTKINRRTFISNAGRIAAFVSLAPIIKACETGSLYSNYIVDPELCTGCEECIAVCNYNSIILVNDDETAFITAEKCTKCGKCEDACPEDAISKL